jgi:hypothetical protein
LKPGNSHHLLLGYKNQFSRDLALDLELYYKSYNNILEYDVATDYDWDNETGTLSDVFNQGKGYTYGADLLLRTYWRGLEGFLGLTLSKTQRKIDNINIDPYTQQAQSFYPKYDRSYACP